MSGVRPCKNGKFLPHDLGAYTAAKRRNDTWSVMHCPLTGEGDDRLQVYTDKKPRVWCRHCNALTMIDIDGQDTGFIPAPVKKAIRKPTLPASMALQMHAVLEPRRRAYFAERGIAQWAIDKYKLGFNKALNRFAIPCFIGNTLWAIQYRITPEDEKRAKQQGHEYLRYISEKGSINRVLFNQDILKIPKIGYVLIVEGPLDALMLVSLGYPTVAKFDGNQGKAGGWEREWNKLLKAVDDVIVIPDNDKDKDKGDLIALAKLEAIPGSRVLRLPQEFKDVGNAYQDGRFNLRRWIGLPPTLQGRIE